VSDPLRVSAPASSANLGPGFDCLALALELRNEVEIRRGTAAEPVVRISGEGAGEAPADAQNLFLRAFERGGADAAGLEFTMTNRVPFARGLGSSAATIAAGLVAAQAWTDGEESDLLALAAEIEGHPDNVAAALNGGLTLAWSNEDGVSAIGFGEPDVAFVVMVPEARLSTAEARAALPAQVPHADAVHTAARAALLVAAIGSGDCELLRDALDDRLHEPYRAPLVPLLGEVRDVVRGRDEVYGVTLSGAGPAVLVWCAQGSEDGVREALSSLAGATPTVLAAAGHGSIVLDA
jgi:homoserine kinase